MGKVATAKSKDKNRTVTQTSLVYKRNDLIQQARFDLSPIEQRIILYTIAKIHPEDTSFQEYSFDIAEFLQLCNQDLTNYTHIRKTLKSLADKSWWAVTDDNGGESLLRWFTTVRFFPKSGQVKIKFHEDMFPYLLQLRQQAINGLYYTQYQLKNILPMRSKYSIRLYELLKSYQRNNEQWYFEINDLKYLLMCQNYEQFGIFRLKILEPAINEINTYSDLCISYQEKKEGRKVKWITFFLCENPSSVPLSQL